MARRLKTYQTSLGFYDLAIAAPSMKAALAGSNLFHQGFAKETDDPDVVAAAMAKPGAVVKRPAGSSGRFAEHSELPDLDNEASGLKKKARRPEPKRRAAPKISDEDARKAAAEFEREQKRRDAERRKEEAAREKSGLGAAMGAGKVVDAARAAGACKPTGLSSLQERRRHDATIRAYAATRALCPSTAPI